MKTQSALLLASLVLTLSACKPPAGSTDLPLNMARSGKDIYDSTAPALPEIPGPQLAYSAPPYPYVSQAWPYTTFAFFQNMPVTVIPSNVGPAITRCTISPDLPAGLSLSSQDCSINGTPSATSAISFYTVTAEGGSGVSRTTISLSVNPPTKVVNIAQGAFVFTVGTAIPPIIPQFSPTASTSGCGALLSSGLSLQSSDCSIRGTPTASGTPLALFHGAADTMAILNFVVPPLGAPGPSLQPLTAVQLPITILASDQPNISFGGIPFGQAIVLAGSSMYPITPTHTGPAITSCSITPALPAGLTLSQSDCSISGTPTSPTAPATFLITAMSGSRPSNVLPLNLMVKPGNIKSLACQSGTLCVHTMMPVWSQSDSGLVAYLKTKGYTMNSDPGWCGGVSSAEILNAYFQEIAAYSSLQSTAWPAPFSATDDEFAFIYKSMVLVGTDIQNGGTFLPSDTLDPFLGNCGTSVDQYSLSPLKLSEFQNPAAYPNGMPLGWMAVNNHSGPGHAVSINGVEGNYFKVFDPWGAVYNASITYDSHGPHQITFVNGNGFNDVSMIDAGSTTISSIQWIKDYVFVKGARYPEKCQ